MKKVFEQLKWIHRVDHKAFGRYLSLAFLLIVSVLFSYGEIFALQYLLDKFLTGMTQDIWIYLVIYLLVLLAKNVYPMFASYFELRCVTQPFVNSISTEMTNVLFLIPYKKLIKRKNTVYIDAQTSSVWELAGSISEFIGIFSNILELLIAAVLFAMISLPLLLVVMVLCVVYIFIGKVYTTKLVDARRNYMEQVSILHQAIEEASTSSREVLSYNRMDWETKRRKSKFADYYKSILRLNFVGNNQYFVTNVARWGIVICVLVASANLAITGMISVVTFVSIYRITENFMRTVENIYWKISNVSRLVVNLDRIWSICNDEDKDSDLEYIDSITKIEFRNVKFLYDENGQNTLVNLNFTIRSGQKIGIVGESGNGKTTLLKLISQALEPIEGEILYNDIAAKKYSKSSIKNKIAVCYQEPYLFADTVENNIKMGRNIDNDKMVDICKAVFIHDTIMKRPDGYQSILADRGLSFSGGERQRLAIARTLLTDADVYLLDEVTASVHPSLGQQLMENIDSYIRRKDAIMVVVTHKLEGVYNADLIFVMDKSTISAIGTHDQLLEESIIYQKLVRESEGLGEELHNEDEGCIIPN